MPTAPMPQDVIDFIKERVLDREFEDHVLRQKHQVRSFADLEGWFRDLLTGMVPEQRRGDED